MTLLVKKMFGRQKLRAIVNYSAIKFREFRSDQVTRRRPRDTKKYDGPRRRFAGPTSSPRREKKALSKKEDALCSYDKK